MILAIVQSLPKRKNIVVREQEIVFYSPERLSRASCFLSLQSIFLNYRVRELNENPEWQTQMLSETRQGFSKGGGSEGIWGWWGFGQTGGFKQI